jgi:hypothetical protein
MTAVAQIGQADLSGEFIADEFDRLINSAKIRMEQQEIHVRELSGNIAEQARARHQLKDMLAGYRRLIGLRDQLCRR